jgi:hypothetical protein
MIEAFTRSAVMRHFVAVTLIACGTLLASAPIGSDFAQALIVRETLAESPAAGGLHFFRQPLEESYRLGCWILGGTMIGLGIIGGCGSRQPAVPKSDPKHTAFAHAAG